MVNRGQNWGNVMSFHSGASEIELTLGDIRAYLEQRKAREAKTAVQARLGAREELIGFELHGHVTAVDEFDYRPFVGVGNDFGVEFTIDTVATTCLNGQLVSRAIHVIDSDSQSEFVKVQLGQYVVYIGDAE